jgi:nitric oxide reductase NorD protein
VSGSVSKGKRYKSDVQKIEELLTSVISPKQSIKPIVQSVTKLSADDQIFVVHWTEVISKSNVELAYYFALTCHQAINELTEVATLLWINQALRLYDTEGLYPAVRFLKDVSSFHESYLLNTYQVTFEEMIGVLTPFIRGLSGRELLIEKGSSVYTDTESIQLPSAISCYRDKEKNRQLYKAMACFLWAQTWFGTFKKTSHQSKALLNRLAHYPCTDINTTYQAFLFLEHIRLMACIKRELPGLYRQMILLHPDVQEALKDNTWKFITQQLAKDTSTVETTFGLLDQVLRLRFNLPAIPYLGTLALEDVEFNIQERKRNQTKEIVEMMEQGLLNKSKLEEAVKAANSEQKQETPTKIENGDGDFTLEDIMKSLSQDVKEIEDDWLNEVESSLQKAKESNQLKHSSSSSILQNQQQEFYYDEWDFERQQYRTDWCRLIEKEIHPAHNNFESQTKEKYHHLLSGIRKAFEVIKDQSTLLRNQTDGEEIDIDAVIKMRTSQMAGEEISERFYLRKNHNNRSFAVLILVDLSGSTKGWINQMEKESLILITEALEILGDQYAIYGFSGLTRQRCEIYPVKKFTNKIKEITLKKIGSLNAKDYTRMGVAIRHSTEHLNAVEAKRKLLIVLSDGKPDDYDGYKGAYGIHDTRRSIEEAQHHGIRLFAITIDQQAQSYLPQLFGRHRYTILNDVNKLPAKLSEIYRRLTQ